MSTFNFLRRLFPFATVVLLFLARVAFAAEYIAILPGELSLVGPEANHRLLVERVENDQYVGLAEGAALNSSDPAVVKIDGDRAVPVANGQATITATLGDATATAGVTVSGMDAPHEWSFRNHIESVLAKAGCSSGACHGALAGKGGFKLTLHGYGPLTDWQTITRQARGRRVELADPGRSLVLAKPTGALPHKGGVRFEVDSLEYRVLSEWIAAGAKPPGDDDPRLERLEVLPALTVLSPGDEQQLLVRAHFTDGRVEDVTRWAKYAATDEAVAMVDDGGRVSVVGRGGGAVTAWYLSQIVVARITSPYDNEVPPEVYAQAERRSFIDEMVLEKLASLRLPPSPPATDDEFLRRAYLDTLGVLPTAEEAQKFLADPSPTKRERLIDELLTRPEFVDYWSYQWSDLLLVSGLRLRPKALEAYYDWIRGHVEANTPWDELVRQIVTATGSSYENGATNFYALHQDPLEMSENTSQAFLGLSINCARCHNHPLEKWTNNQYYAMANLFARVRAKGWGGDFRNGDGLRTLYVDTKGDLIQPLTGKPQPPAPLDGEPVDIDSPDDRRVHLARWLTAPENPYFSRAIANRVWANFFGVGLVEREDDLRTSNPASNEELLSAVADYLVANDFNLKELMRLIMQSAAYQRSSRPLPENQDEQRFYSRYYPRRLMAEVLLDAISQVTGVPSEFKDFDKGTRALELPDSNVASAFLKTFGRPDRVITCSCERSEEPSMVQVLHISNGDTINHKLAAKDNAIDKLLEAGKADAEIIEEAYLAALARYPTDEEKTKLLAVFAEAGDAERRILIEDVYWGILSSREFLFNH